MPNEMTGEVGECNCHLVQPEQDGIDRCPHICSVRHLEEIAHNDPIIEGTISGNGIGNMRSLRQSAYMLCDSTTKVPH
jgi:hypothetical protein